MHTVHNARILLLATALNNLALAFIVTGFVAPALTGRLHAVSSILATLAWLGPDFVLHAVAQLALALQLHFD